MPSRDWTRGPSVGADVPESETGGLILGSSWCPATRLLSAGHARASPDSVSAPRLGLHPTHPPTPGASVGIPPGWEIVRANVHTSKRARPWHRVMRPHASLIRPFPLARKQKREPFLFSSSPSPLSTSLHLLLPTHVLIPQEPRFPCLFPLTHASFI